MNYNSNQGWNPQGPSLQGPQVPGQPNPGQTSPQYQPPAQQQMPQAPPPPGVQQPYQPQHQPAQQYQLPAQQQRPQQQAQAPQRARVPIEGQNIVTLVGYLGQGTKTYVGQNNTPMYKGRVVIPVNSNGRSSEYSVKISGWEQLADSLASLPEGTAVQLSGSYSERSYDKNCQSCGGQYKAYWSEIRVDGLRVIG